MNPYKIDTRKLKKSQAVSDGKEILKLQLASKLMEIISEMPTQEVIAKTGLDKADLSRLRVLNVDRFTIDRIITLINSLGFTTTFKVESKKVS